MAVVCTESVSPERASTWVWLDENWRQYVRRSADLARSPMTVKAQHDSGVYFLWDASGALLYVGQTIHMRERMDQHRRNPAAACWSYIPMDWGLWAAAEQIEGCYIRALDPPLNKPTRLKMWPGHSDMVAAIRAA